METTDVIFRKDSSGVFALFPGIAGTADKFTCLSFQHIGQHGSADIQHCIHNSSPARPDEYADLRRELESVPYEYRLRVVQRSTIKHQRDREKQLNKISA